MCSTGNVSTVIFNLCLQCVRLLKAHFHIHRGAQGHVDIQESPNNQVRGGQARSSPREPQPHEAWHGGKSNTTSSQTQNSVCRRLRGLQPRVRGHMMGCIIGRALGDCTRVIMGHLGQEPKARKGKAQDNTGMSKCGKIVG